MGVSVSGNHAEKNEYLFKNDLNTGFPFAIYSFWLWCMHALARSLFFFLFSCYNAGWQRINSDFIEMIMDAFPFASML